MTLYSDSQKHTHQKKDQYRQRHMEPSGPCRLYVLFSHPLASLPPTLLPGPSSCWLVTLRGHAEASPCEWSTRQRATGTRFSVMEPSQKTTLTPKNEGKAPSPLCRPLFLYPSFPPNSSWAPSPLNSHLWVCSPPFSDRPMLRGTVFAPPFSSALPPKTKTVPWSAPTRRQDVVGAPHMPRTLAS